MSPAILSRRSDPESSLCARISKVRQRMDLEMEWRLLAQLRRLRFPECVRRRPAAGAPRWPR